MAKMRPPKIPEKPVPCWPMTRRLLADCSGKDFRGCTRAPWNGRWPAPPPRKAPETSGERATPGDVTRYEQLGQQILGGDTGGWRLGRAFCSITEWRPGCWVWWQGWWM